MSYNMTAADLTSEWSEVIGDFTTIHLLQVRGNSALQGDGPAAEVMVASTTPTAADHGVELYVGNILTASVLENLGDGGPLYARAVGRGVPGMKVQLTMVNE